MGYLSQNFHQLTISPSHHLTIVEIGPNSIRINARTAFIFEKNFAERAARGIASSQQDLRFISWPIRVYGFEIS